MKALTLLLGARSMGAADAARSRPSIPEGTFRPLASTVETARAWRTWAESAPTPRPRVTPAPAAHPASSPTFLPEHRGSL